jgi:hypothetical protein
MASISSRRQRQVKKYHIKDTLMQSARNFIALASDAIPLLKKNVTGKLRDEIILQGLFKRNSMFLAGCKNRDLYKACKIT